MQVRDETIYWKTSASSSFFLAAEKTQIKIEEELLAFDSEDLINGLGGALGLLVGWSLLFLFNEGLQIVKLLYDRFVQLFNT